MNESEIAGIRVSTGHKFAPFACRRCTFVVSRAGHESGKDLFSKWFSDRRVCKPVTETDRALLLRWLGGALRR